MTLQTFGPYEEAVLSRAAVVAEESVSDFFHLTEGFWAENPFELRTGRYLQAGEVSPCCLAQVLKMRSPPAGRRLRARDFYRICLQDHNLIDLLQRERRKDLIEPLLVYILAHELVHVVRFSKHLHLFEADLGQRQREETKVHALTADLLGRLRLPGLDRVVNLYESHYAGVVDFAQASEPKGYEQCRFTNMSAIPVMR